MVLITDDGGGDWNPTPPPPPAVTFGMGDAEGTNTYQPPTPTYDTSWGPNSAGNGQYAPTPPPAFLPDQPQWNPLLDWAQTKVGEAYDNTPYAQAQGEAKAYNDGLEAWQTGQPISGDWMEAYGQELMDPSYNPSSAGYQNFNAGPPPPDLSTNYGQMFYDPDPNVRWALSRILTDQVPPGAIRESMNAWPTFNDPGGDRQWRPEIAQRMVSDFLNQGGYSDEMKQYAGGLNTTILASDNPNNGGFFYPDQGAISLGGPSSAVFTHELTHANNYRTGDLALPETMSVLSRLSNETDPQYAQAAAEARGIMANPRASTPVEGTAYLLMGLYGAGGINALPPYARALFENMFQPGAGEGYPQNSATDTSGDWANTGVRWDPDRRSNVIDNQPSPYSAQLADHLSRGGYSGRSTLVGQNR